MVSEAMIGLCEMVIHHGSPFRMKKKKSIDGTNIFEKEWGKKERRVDQSVSHKLGMWVSMYDMLFLLTSSSTKTIVGGCEMCIFS